MSIERTRIVVVGCGASGVIAAANLARALGQAGDVLVVERGGAPGLGLAYATRDPNHLLNVRAANMSAFPNDPDHFVRWLQKRGPDFGAGGVTPFCFVERRVYGAYLGDLFEGATMDGVQLIDAGAVRIEPWRDGVEVQLDDGTSIVADAVVLATGHDPKPPRQDGVADAWTPGALDGVGRDDEVIVIGTGLTMIDTVLSLDSRGHRGPIRAISRRGLLSAVHAAVEPRPIPASAIPFGAPLSQLLHCLRRHAADAAASGADWRSTVDALRPHTRRLWQAMSTDQRRRFLRHARAWWDVHRHRMAPAIARRIEALRETGRLEIVTGRVLGAAPGPDGTELRVRLRGAQADTRLVARRVIDATGLPCGPFASPNPVIAHLVEDGHARPAPLGFGLDLADDAALIARDGQVSDRLFAVGPLGRAAFWEIIAIPDIRQQCADLAEDLAGRLGGRRKRRVAR